MRLLEKLEKIFERTNILQGGIGDNLEVSEVNRDQVIMGIEVELEMMEQEAEMKNDGLTNQMSDSSGP